MTVVLLVGGGLKLQPLPTDEQHVDGRTTSPGRLGGDRQRDFGFTLVEVLIVIVIIGVLSAMVVFAVRSVADKGEQSACGTDARTLSTAVEVYFVEFETETLPATGAGDDRFEQTLVDAGFLKTTSQYYDVDAAGVVTTNGVPCT